MQLEEYRQALSQEVKNFEKILESLLAEMDNFGVIQSLIIDLTRARNKINELVVSYVNSK